MTQATRIMDQSLDGTDYTVLLNNSLKAVDSSNAEVTAPTLDLVEGKLWFDTTSLPGTMKVYTDGNWVNLIPPAAVADPHTVGSVVMYANSTDPNTLFAGTWVKIDGKFIRATPDGDTVGDTGGADNKTLSSSNIPAHAHSNGSLATNSAGNHRHKQYYQDEAKGDGIKDTVGSSGSYKWGGYAGSHSHDVTGSTSSYGSGSSFDNRPAFINLNVWQRVS